MSGPRSSTVLLDLRETFSYTAAIASNADTWVSACQGTERPFTGRAGVRMLYCYNPKQVRHAYINLDTDIEMTNEEVDANLA